MNKGLHPAKLGYVSTALMKNFGLAVLQLFCYTTDIVNTCVTTKVVAETLTLTSWLKSDQLPLWTLEDDFPVRCKQLGSPCWSEHFMINVIVTVWRLVSGDCVCICLHCAEYNSGQSFPVLPLFARLLWSTAAFISVLFQTYCVSYISALLLICNK